MSRVVAAIVALIVLIAIGTSVYALTCQGADILDAATFLVLALTLGVLVHYAFETHRIADVTAKQWEEQCQPQAGYEMVVPHPDDVAMPAVTVFTVMNHSRQFVHARVWCHFGLNGNPIQADPRFDGQQWRVYPYQLNREWFDIRRLLERNGRRLEQMHAEATPENRDTQLTMDLELEFSNELGRTRRYPPRRHFFDFQAFDWIPVSVIGLSRSDDLCAASTVGPAQ